MTQCFALIPVIMLNETKHALMQYIVLDINSKTVKIVYLILKYHFLIEHCLLDCLLVVPKKLVRR